MMKLAITREADQLADLSAKAAALGVEIVPLPVTEMRPVPFGWPSALMPEKIDWLFFTSANAVRYFFERIKTLDFSVAERTRFGAVGGKTEKALSEYTKQAEFIPIKPGGQALFEEFAAQADSDQWTIVYPRAASVYFDPADLMKLHGMSYFPIICYETIFRTVESSEVSAIKHGDCILFTSPSAVESYQQQFGKPIVRLIAIGRTTWAAMMAAGWADITLMKEPDLNLVVEYL